MMHRCMIVVLLGASISLGQQSMVRLPQDSGPDKIDVTAYPEPFPQQYRLFSEKCSKCHTIARPINTTMVRAEWERYVKRMMHKPNSGIGDKQGKQIFDFLLFDESNRKAKNPASFFKPLGDEAIQKLQEQQQGQR